MSALSGTKNVVSMPQVQTVPIFTIFKEYGFSRGHQIGFEKGQSSHL
jgi:hypothetical protein